MSHLIRGGFRLANVATKKVCQVDVVSLEARIQASDALIVLYTYVYRDSGANNAGAASVIAVTTRRLTSSGLSLFDQARERLSTWLLVHLVLSRQLEGAVD